MLGRVVLLLIAVALVAAGCSQASDPATTATAIADEWIVAWMADDVDAIVDLFTVDGSYKDPLRGIQGQESIRSFVESMVPSVTYGERLGEGVPTASESFVFPMRFESHGEMFVGEFEVELSGDVASRIEWLSWVAEA